MSGQGAKANTLFGVALVLIAVFLLLSCAQRPGIVSMAPPVPTIGSIDGPGGVVTATTAAIPVESAPIVTIPDVAVAADADRVAIRVDPPATAAPIDYDALADSEYSEFSCSAWAGEALEAGWPREQVPKVLRTMYRESHCTEWIRSTTSDSGLMQINDIVLRDHRFKAAFPGFDPQSLFHGPTNLRVALWLWGVDGWTPWRGGA